MGITVEGATKSFGDFQALNDVSIDVPNGSLTALLRRYHPGSMVPLAWTGPDGSSHTAVVTLAAGPAG